MASVWRWEALFPMRRHGGRRDGAAWRCGGVAGDSRPVNIDLGCRAVRLGRAGACSRDWITRAQSSGRPLQLPPTTLRSWRVLAACRGCANFIVDSCVEEEWLRLKQRARAGIVFLFMQGCIGCAGVTHCGALPAPAKRRPGNEVDGPLCCA